MGTVVVTTLIGDIFVIACNDGSWPHHTSGRDIQNLIGKDPGEHPTLDSIAIVCLPHKGSPFVYRAQLLEQGEGGSALTWATTNRDPVYTCPSL